MAERPSTAAVAAASSDFDRWVVEEYRLGTTSGFTALVILVRIKKKAIALRRSTYLHVIGEETGWSEVHALFSQSGARWDGAALFVKRGPEGGPLDDFSAGLFLLDQQKRVADDRLIINEGHFFDVWGRRMRIDEVAR
jgi:hypothetical protein